MHVARRRDIERLLQKDLARGAIQKVLAAHDVGDFLRGIIKDHGQLIGPKTVGSTYDKVACALRNVLTQRAAQSIDKGNGPALGAKTPGTNRFAVGTVATGARVNPVRECQALFFFLNLLSRAGTAVDKIRLFERFKGFFVKLVTIGLSNNRLVAHEIELT